MDDNYQTRIHNLMLTYKLAISNEKILKLKMANIKFKCFKEQRPF